MPHTDEILRAVAATVIAVALPMLAACGDAFATHGVRADAESATAPLSGMPRRPPPL